MKIQKYHWKYIFFHHQMLRIFIHYDDLKINWQNFETDAWMLDFLGSVRQLDWKLILWGVYCKRWNGQVMEEIMSCIMIDRFLLAKRTSPKSNSTQNVGILKTVISKPELSSMQKKRRNEPLMLKKLWAASWLTDSSLPNAPHPNLTQPKMLAFWRQ